MLSARKKKFLIRMSGLSELRLSDFTDVPLGCPPRGEKASVSYFQKKYKKKPPISRCLTP